MPARWVIHAATMELGGPTSREIIERATRSTLAKAEELGARSLALVAFGTGVGGFPVDEAARVMVGAAREHDRRPRADRVRGARRGSGAGVPRGALSLPVLVAPDSFKGTFSAREVAAAIAAGCARPAARRASCPWPTAARARWTCSCSALGGEVRTVTASDPLGRPVEAPFALLPDGSAVVEMAQASGLGLVAEDERDAWAASTRGTGELIAAAAEAGAARSWSRSAARRPPTAARAHSRRWRRPASTRRRRTRGRCVTSASLRGRPARLRAAEGRRRGDGQAAGASGSTSWRRASRATRAASR